MFEVTDSWLMPANIAITAVFLLFFFMGMHKGLLRQAVSLIGTIASFYGSWLVSSVLAQYIRIWPQEWAILQDTPYAEAASFYLNQISWLIAVFLVLRLLFVILDNLAKGLSEVPLIDVVDDLGGGAVGIVEAALLCVVFTISLGTPLFTNGIILQDESLLKPVNEVTGTVFHQFVSPVINGETLRNLYEQGSKISEEQRINLENWMKENGLDPIVDRVSYVPGLTYEVRL